jgi:uncharacterized protein
MNHDDVVSDWQRNAEAHDDANFKFLRSLKFKRYGFSPDKLAKQLHQEAFQIVDCTRCANCCKTMDVALTDKDITRIAGHLGMTTEDFIAKYLEPGEEQGYDEEKGCLWIRQKPCPFLGEDNRCTIYDLRPAVCRDYPYTDKKEFTTRSHGHSRNALLCPAVFWIVEQMKRRAGR